MAESTGMHSIPNEILISLLSTFRTLELLPMTLVSHRFHSLIVRILHHRLLETAQLKDHKLILECFHPSTKLSTPYLFCDFLGTHPLNSSSSCSNEEFLSQTEGYAIGQLGKLKSLYSHFLPLKPDSDKKVVRSHPAGGSFSIPNGLVDEHDQFVCQNIHLESHEPFSQLQTITSLVKVGPKRGLFLSSVNIGDSILRIWREWLAERARAGISADDGEGSEETVRRRCEGLRWVDNSETVGLRLRVVEREEDAPVLVGRDEDPAVSYTLQYEELVIKTTQLLLLVEQSIDQEVNHSGKAVVIGSWDR
ncbi:hypothetical protein ONS95_012710 [Cadophora gregata]|uniref:uncharacterized protein n=1 Tax=Cadophora gregata TaxID=51156 RepID=UPI0026DBAC68|nr:uncharacterized protein ONS95_012710 [Cadophora gregata]KAK0118423.1 hypothetical protein ONS95_012710 [Cadophora gregata]KAK0123490.1 hypothetical protein ONS96_010473 [Cadophora gregata f. sp. sojae]